MKRLPVFVLLAALPGASPHAEAGDDQLTVHASAVKTQMAPVDPGQGRLALPGLTFSLEARYACGDGAAVASITVSVADTLERYLPDDGEHSITAAIDVPGRQLPPVATGGFCVRGAPNEQRFLELPAVATAQVSLRCRSETRTSMRYASAPLALRLECSSPEDQEPAAVAVPAAR